MSHDALQNLFSLRGRIALVTGASGGIGQALSAGLAMAGATVALNGRSIEKLELTRQQILAEGGAAESFPADLSDHDAVAPLAAAVLERFGRVDILVNCAGANQRMPILDVTPDVYDRIMATNLRSVFFLSQAIAPGMRQHGGGKIINIGSLTSSIALSDVSVYGMTKSAVAQLTKTMAVEWAQYNIQVNCLCPGFILTDLTRPLWEHQTRSAWMLERLPTRRPGKPEDLVGLAIYLASAASDYTTGQSFYVDGGFLSGSPW